MDKIYWRLVQLGAHFGDTVYGHNFSTECYVVGVRNGYYVIDVSKTILMLRLSLRFIRKVSSCGGKTVLYYYNGFHFEMLTIFLSHLAKVLPLSILYQKWIPGTISNYYSCFYDLLNEVQDLNWIDERKKVSFISLFFRILYFTVMDLPVDTTIEDQYIKALSYWRAVVFFRFFQSYYSLPDSAVCVDASYSTKICQEFCSMGIPVISPLNTRSNLMFVSYPVLSNNSSPLLCLFYFSIFSSAIREGRRINYDNIMGSNALFLKKEFRRRHKYFYARVGALKAGREKSRFALRTLLKRVYKPLSTSSCKKSRINKNSSSIDIKKSRKNFRANKKPFRIINMNPGKDVLKKAKVVIKELLKEISKRKE